MTITRRNALKLAAGAGVALAGLKQQALAAALKQQGLAELYKDDFYVGTAMGVPSLRRQDPKVLGIIAREFNAITAENAMKSALMQPEEGKWVWDVADRFVEFGEQHNLYIVGHTLVWHSQAPNWLFVDKDGNPTDKQTLFARQQEHIETLVGRYKGRIQAWDVVNEAINEGEGWRESSWYTIGGPEFMERAFRLTHAVDPDAHLMYNDYNMHNPGKREILTGVFKDYLDRDVPIHGVGMQGHVGLGYPDLEEFEATIVAMGELGLKVHITELEVDVLPTAWEFTGAEISTDFEYSDKLNPYVDGLPDDIQEKLTARYVELFKLFRKHSDIIERVTLWGTSDAQSWKNNFPVRGRTNYPLLFDRNLEPKPAYHALKKMA